MRLYLVRHGIAEDISPEGAHTDAERELTGEGRKKTAVSARALKALKVSPQAIGTSPLPRAKQTAEILARVLAPKVALTDCKFLVDGPGTTEVIAWLHETKVDSAMLVGHMPHLAELASDLLSGSARARIALKRSAACCLSFEGEPGEGKGTLEWLLFSLVTFAR